MILDARSVPRDAALDADVCIVGAGAAGTSLALELADGPLRVCLLESGGLEADEDTTRLNRGVNVGHPYFRLDQARSRFFGGSTNCWMGLCLPLEPLDFEARDWIPHSGWPFGAEELRPYYERAQRVLRLARFAYDGPDWEGAGRPDVARDAPGLVTRVLQLAPTRFGEVYREPLAKSGSVDVYLWANAVEIETDEHARVARGVRVACLDGNRFSVRSRALVLAAGGIENPRLLLASNRVRAEGLGNARDLVGRFFMEHPHLPGAVLLPSPRSNLALYRPVPRGGVQVFGAFAPAPAVLRRERIASFTAWLVAERAPDAFERSLARASADLDGAAPADALPPPVGVLTENEQVPDRDSRVKLSPERDALGLPRVLLAWRLTELDRRHARRGQELLARELARAGVGRLRPALSAEGEAWPDAMVGGRHHMGTTRMHASPDHGVADAEARVHGLANLYVAGSSLFPTCGASNPTLTIVALTLRLADHLKGELA